MDISSILNSFNFECYNEKTRITMTTLLKVCSKYKCHKVGVCKKDETFSDKHNYEYFDWLYIDGKDNSGWPIVWKVAEETNKILSKQFKEYDPFTAGCGNGNSYQIHSKYIIPGIYEIVNNKWTKIS